MIDHVVINIMSGKGGNGAVSFRHEKYVPFGGPFGGDGGKGGDVIFIASSNKMTLQEFRHGKRYEAENGENGRTKNQRGSSGKDLVIEVPVGTIVQWKHLIQHNQGSIDLDVEGATVAVANGGQGGRGNSHFATSTNRAPRLGESGEKGDVMEITLDLKLLADVGLVGLPNAGKSSFLKIASGAHPKIGDYAFTTIEPNLGVVNISWTSLILADIPGLIEGAHNGKGLGDQFLRHIERTAVILHLIDGTDEDPVASWRSINNEIGLYSPELLAKHQVVVINKIDIPEVIERKLEIEESFKNEGVSSIEFVSAATGQNINEVLSSCMPSITNARENRREFISIKNAILRPKPTDDRPVIELVEEGVWKISHSKAERLFGAGNLSEDEVITDMWRELKNFGAIEELEKAGAKPGDTVILGEITLIWR
jgi:GTP-binding protein